MFRMCWSFWEEMGEGVTDSGVTGILQAMGTPKRMQAQGRWRTEKYLLHSGRVGGSLKSCHTQE